MRIQKTIFILICLGLAGLIWFGLKKEWPDQSSQPNILLITVDTLGAEHVGAYSPDLNTTPNIDRLASQGALFQNAYSVAPWTKPSFASIFTGLMPLRHGVRGLGDTLSSQMLTMAERFGAIGYQSAGFISHVFLNAKHGFDQGFDKYAIVEFPNNVHDAVTSDKVTNAALDWLAGVKNSPRPFFLFTHYFDPHYNFQHHPKFDRTSGYQGPLKPGLKIRKLRRMIPRLTRADIQYLINLYHEEIAYTDFHIGRLLDELKKQGLSDNTIVILTADHGEEFLGHGRIGHTATLYDELIKIPLIISWPGKVKAQKFSSSASLVDILPTLLELVGQPGTESDGRSFAACLRTDECNLEERDIFAEVDFVSGNISAHKWAVVRGKDKLIEDEPTKAKELYDRQVDRAEQQNLITTKPERANDLWPELLKYKRGQRLESKPDSKKHSPEEVEQLKSLGYM